MRTILACAVFAFLGLGCAGNLDPEVSQDEAPLATSPVAPEALSCDHPPTCVFMCACDYKDCIAFGGDPRSCDEERFYCVLGCRH